MNRFSLRRTPLRLGLLAALALATGCASLPWQGGSEREVPAPPTPRGLTVKEFLAEPHGKYVVVDLDVNEVRFMDGRTVLWKGKAGTGTGLRLQGEDGHWDFSTPNGVLYVQFKELEPVWILPDWYFIENKLPVPPMNSPKRKRPGDLGDAALYIGHELAIHGTDKPELLGKRVSHGCIRLSNADVRRLFHNVQVGTPVLIVGRAELLTEAGDSSEIVPYDQQRKIKAKPRQPNPLLKLSTAQLLARLDQQLKARDTLKATWTATAGTLVERGVKDDALALRGLLQRAGTARTERFNREYATFLADAFARGGLRTVVSLARIPAVARERAAAAIVTATMDLYAGPLQQVGAPWPTLRVPMTRLGPDGQVGWKALRGAETVYREEAPAHRLASGLGGS